MIKIKILDVLHEKDRNLNWLATNGGITYSTLYNLAHKKTNSISYNILEKICKTLKCDVCDIIEYIPENKKETSEIDLLDSIINNAINNSSNGEQYLSDIRRYIYKTLYSLLLKTKTYPNDNEEKRQILEILIKCAENKLLPKKDMLNLIELI